MAGFVNDLDALRMIFQVNERAMFDIVVSRNTLREVRAKGDAVLPDEFAIAEDGLERR
jgi:hypothetical protein